VVVAAGQHTHLLERHGLALLVGDHAVQRGARGHLQGHLAGLPGEHGDFVDDFASAVHSGTDAHEAGHQPFAAEPPGRVGAQRARGPVHGTESDLAMARPEVRFVADLDECVGQRFAVGIEHDAFERAAARCTDEPQLGPRLGGVQQQAVRLVACGAR
jgi:hypothetical protein